MWYNGTDINIKGKRYESYRKTTHRDSGGSDNHGRQDDEPKSRAWHGLQRALINNAVVGVTKGYEKKLEINGVGFRLSGGGSDIEMALGFSHPVKYHAPEGVQLTTNKMEITVSGIDKQKVGQVAAEIRSLKKPEPYKGKGIKYVDEVILRKAGKAGKK